MKKTVIFCDICKKDISHEDERYRFKKYEGIFSGYDNFEWIKLDMCHDCYCGFLAYLISIKRSDNNA